MTRSILAFARHLAGRLRKSLAGCGRALTAAGLGGLLATIALLAALVAPAGSAELGMPDAVHGEQVFMKYCSACHHEQSRVGPPMVDAVGYFIRAGVPAQALGPLFYHPVRQRPAGSIMPAFSPEEVSDADLNDLGYYLGSQTPAPAAPPALGVAENGAELYAANCAICHGDETGAGANTVPLAMFASELKQGGAPPFVMLGFVNLACRSGYEKGMPTYTAEQLSDEQLADIAAYIYALPAPQPAP